MGLLAVVGAILLLTLIPGADFFLVTKETIRSGRMAGMLMAAGICLGCVLQGFAVGLGLTWLLVSHPGTLHMLQFLGGVYLIYLGVLSLRQQASMGLGEQLNASNLSPVDGWPRYILRGLASNLLNPKISLCYIALIPQPCLRNAPIIERAVLVMSIHVIISVLWFFVLIRLSDRLRLKMSRGRMPIYMSRAAAACLILLGSVICVECH
jgi:threonine/homoserine/homoserine lactone efflux protein